MTGPLVGILGGGQLGRMLALAAAPLGIRTRCLDPDPLCPAGQVTGQIVAGYDDEEALRRLARGTEVVTVEFENVPSAAARCLEDHVPFHPCSIALAAAQERLAEKWLFRALEIPTPRFVAVESFDTLARAARFTGLPAILKTRRLGYDGKGQHAIRSEPELKEAWDALGGVPLILEEMILFDREVSIIAVRSRTGETAFYPLIENHHERGILRLSISPAPRVTNALQSLAEDYARRVLGRLGYVGVLAIEFFERGGELIANEMACRVHNSGHWTIEGAECSQFENHLRAILGLPIGSTRARGQSAMVNFIGSISRAEMLLRLPGAHVHLYGKEARPWRKLGHVTLCAPDEALLSRDLQHVRAALREQPAAPAEA
jgi:5-(carboxyamino)imidazole ribonucleotide synthase